jgi:hypothetical protein
MENIFARFPSNFLPNLSKGKDYRPLRLKVRHYIDYDNEGVARIYLSRLVDLYGISPKSV